jgi:hypothetical protein
MFAFVVVSLGVVRRFIACGARVRSRRCIRKTATFLTTRLADLRARARSPTHTAETRDKVSAQRKLAVTKIDDVAAAAAAAVADEPSATACVTSSRTWKRKSRTTPVRSTDVVVRFA